MNTENEKAVRTFRKIGIAEYERLVKRVIYKDGDLFWTEASKTRCKGKKVGYPDKNGYLRTNVYRVGMVSVHSIIFFMFHRTLPDYIDHIDGNLRNNRIENLRACTAVQNAHNMDVNVRSKSGVKGVRWNKWIGRWEVAITVNRTLIRLGSFADKNDAIRCRIEAVKEHYGEFGMREVKNLEAILIHAAANDSIFKSVQGIQK